MMKMCSRCKLTFPATTVHFYGNKSRSDGLQSYCRDCQRSYNADRKDAQRIASQRWYQAHREQRLAAARAWQAAHVEEERARHQRARARAPEQHRAKSRRYAASHQESERARCVTYRANHRAEVRARVRAYDRAHPERQRESHARRAAQRLGLPFEKVSYRAILARDGYICHICGGLVLPVDLSYDHIVPFAKGGPHLASNVAVCHLDCNRRKSAKLVASAIPPAV